MKKRFRMMVGLLLLGMTARAQTVTKNHDPAKMNQITVMESGTGELTPAGYYYLLHGNYNTTAAETNKLLSRSAMGIFLQQQKDYAQEIDSSLVKRSAVEALNMADRSGGALDLAWQAEGEKLTEEMNRFKSNITHIRWVGGTTEDYDYWMTYYNVFACAIRNTQDSYLPNADRKKQYLSIYEDVREKNEKLIRFVAGLSSKRKMNRLLNASGEKVAVNKAAIVVMVKSRWLDASRRASGYRVESE